MRGEGGLVSFTVSLQPPAPGLGKRQTPGLKLAGALGPQEERGLNPKPSSLHLQLLPAIDFTKKAMQPVPIIYLPTYNIFMFK